MIQLLPLVEYANQALKIKQFNDYCPNGLQVEGRKEVKSILSAVTASAEAINAAIEVDADVLLVHHGYFWRGEDPVITGLKRKRIGLLVANNISLLAYHLPLDAHPDWGNNVRLAEVIGLEVTDFLMPDKMGLVGRMPSPTSLAELTDQVAKTLNRQPQVVSGGEHVINTLGWCTGAAQDMIEQAASLGLDAFISGEISERTYHQAKEHGIHYIAAGHHATERYGVQAFGEHLAAHFDLQYRFFDEDNPI